MNEAAKTLLIGREKLAMASDYTVRAQDILLPGFSKYRFLTSRLQTCLVALDVAMQEIDRLLAVERTRAYPQEDDGDVEYYEPLPSGGGPYGQEASQS